MAKVLKATCTKGDGDKHSDCSCCGKTIVEAADHYVYFGQFASLCQLCAIAESMKGNA